MIPPILADADMHGAKPSVVSEVEQPDLTEIEGPHASQFRTGGFPSFKNDEDGAGRAAGEQQKPLDLIDEASMESFPCSDPPSYTRCHV